MKSMKMIYLAVILMFSWMSASAVAEMATSPLVTVNVNTASAAEIAETLKGVGTGKAEAIVAYREEKGAFDSADSLAQVKGIGKATVDKNRERIVIE